MKAAAHRRRKRKAFRPTREARRSAPPCWEARLCELELRLTELQSKARRARDAGQRLPASLPSSSKPHDFSPVGLVTLDARGMVLDINRAGSVLLGGQKSWLLRRPFAFFFDPGEMPKVMAHLRQCAREHKTVSSELRLRASAGSPIVRISTTPVLDEDACVKFLETALIDVTMAKQSQAAEQAMQRNLRALLEASPHPVQFKDETGRWLLANTAAIELFDLSGFDYRNKRDAELAEYSPFYRATLQAGEEMDRAALAARRPTRGDEVVPKPDGSARVLDVIRVPLLPSNDLPKGVVVLSYDITERRQAEEALRTQEAQLRLITDLTPILLSRCTADRRYAFVNRAYAELFCLSSEQIIGKPISEILGPEGYQTILPYVETVLQGKPVEYEIEIPLRQVGRRVLRAVYIPEKDGRDRVLGWIASLLDVTERKQAERRLAANLAVTRILAESSSLSDAIPKFLQTISELLDWRLGILWAFDSDVRALRCLEVWHPPGELEEFAAVSRNQTFAPGIGLPGRVASSLRPVWIPDLTEAETFFRTRVAAAAGIHAGFAFPILRGDELFGVMEFFSDEIRERDEALLEMFASIGSQIGQFMERKQAEEALRQARDQLELQVQERTAELRQANSALRAEIAAHREAQSARNRLAAIVESSEDAIVSATSDLNIISWNRGAEQTYGYSAAEMMGNSLSKLIPAADFNEFRELCARVQRGEVVEPFDTIRLGKDLNEVDVSLTLSPVRNAEGQITGFSDVARDISQRKKAEISLQESEARLQAFMDNSPAMIFVKDLQGRYLHFNRQFAERFRLVLEETVGKTDADIFPEHQAASFRGNDLKVLETGRPMVFDEASMQQDGVHTGIVVKFPLYDHKGTIYALGGIVTDITERKRLEAEVLQISEREQRRIAQDLHDGLGQQLAGISCLLDVLKKNLEEQESPQAPTAARISKLVDTAVGQTRSLARGLYPVQPEQSGLMSALEDLSRYITDLFRIDCQFVCRKPVLFESNAVAAHLYRIAQEAITNALKHGRAQQIRIELSSTPEQIVLAITDNGVGLRNMVNPVTGLGLRTMRYRAGIIGGTIDLVDRPGCGANLVCTLPAVR